jgi:hypothetical protein
VSYLGDLLRGLGFDYCYLEHGIFYSLAALLRLLQRHHLQLFDVEFNPSKGGSLRGFVQHVKGLHEVSERIAHANTRERFTYLDVPATYHDYQQRFDLTGILLRNNLDEYRQRNLRIAGFGASATVTTLLHHYKLAPYLDYLVDDNALRHGTVSPGHHLPVCDPSRLTGEQRPDVCVILAWRYADMIIERHRDFLTGGGVFLVPLPKYREVTGK